MTEVIDAKRRDADLQTGADQTLPRTLDTKLSERIRLDPQLARSQTQPTAYRGARYSWNKPY